MRTTVYHTKAALQAAILHLEHLLSANVLEESEYQKYFEQHVAVFEVFGCVESIPLTKASGLALPRDDYSGLQPEPDFLVQNREGLWEIFEIKTPVTSSLVQTRNQYRKKLSERVADYIAQTETYEHYFSRNPANRKAVKEKLGIDVQENMDITIVVGLSAHCDKREVHSQTRRRNAKITIVTYDDVIDRLQALYRRHYGKHEGVPGVSLNMLVRLHKGSSDSRAYIWDMLNRPGSDRFSIYLESDCLFAVLVTSSGLFELASVPNVAANFYDRWVYFCCSVSQKDGVFAMNFTLNTKELEYREKLHDASFSLSGAHIFLGANHEGMSCATMDVVGIALAEKTLNFKDKRKVYYYYRSLTRGRFPFLQFAGKQFMSTTGGKELSQVESEKQPLPKDM